MNFGAPLAFGSDAPVESPNPFWGLYAAVTRKRADASDSEPAWFSDQALTLSEAFAAYTFGAAYAANAEYRLGKLAEKYHADLIVLDVDPFEIPSKDLLTLTANSVMINGDWVLQ